ncbi:1,4-alpha-glucan branching protein GlgB [Terrarubrum flagellatum]|uniref:1,4-alpha-glucan branching protein GlgB n=1 Tax=Terrirubrum flagellatum TaxID=2895980 RepID=UPI003144FF2C
MIQASDFAPPPLSGEDLAALNEARHGDPFSFLGPHRIADRAFVVRAYLPGANAVDLQLGDDELAPMSHRADGLFEGVLVDRTDYKLRISWPGAIQRTADPYSFPEILTDVDLHLFNEGRHFDLAERFGANPASIRGVDGVSFAVWAPNAKSVSVIADFNGWDARRHPMRLLHGAGVWELFIPGVAPGAVYKYAIVAADGRRLPWKADPLARRTETPPRTASVVTPKLEFAWTDGEWMAARQSGALQAKPLSIYEVHVGAWLRTNHDHIPSWDEACERLVPYLTHMGFTHVELMPVMEHPFGGSWGYQPLSLFAPTSRLGPPEAFVRFVDACHKAGIGVLLDWVPAHFPSDDHGLAQFDGTALYEHQDPREGFHHDWNTLIYNIGRREVRGFLLASALWWLEKFHLDGLRVDAVASMLYRDYSRPHDQWIPNMYGGRENLEAISFFRELNDVIAARCPGAITIAEESTAWPGVTRPTEHGGLGFDFKWNMGWMHDTLRFFARDPVHRSYHLDDVTFGLIYAFSEQFILPLSHDEVVHGKGSLLSRMPGDDWRRFANLRLCLALMWGHPGKKLLFMGGEFGQQDEWNVDAAFPWPHPDDRYRQGCSTLVRDLNGLYRSQPALHVLDRSPQGFAWIIADDARNTVFAFRRSSGDAARDIIVIANMTTEPRHDYRVGVPRVGRWREILNTDSDRYGGSNVGNLGEISTESIPSHGEQQSLSLTLPPLGALMFVRRDA